MNIPVKITSTITGRVVQKYVTPRQLLDFLDEDDMVDNLTMCNCQPIGETYVIDCDCNEEWDGCTVRIGEEIVHDRMRNVVGNKNERKE